MQEVLFKRFERVRKRTEEICAQLNANYYSAQPADFVSPPKWHLGHTTWFFEEMILAKEDANYKRYNKDFSFYFNSYYNNVGDRIIRSKRGELTQPSVSDILAYRKHVSKAIENFYNKSLTANFLNVFEIGIHHEEQHQELLIYDIKYILYSQANYLNIKLTKEPITETVDVEYLKIKEGVYEIGFDGDEFAYDNEKRRHKVYIHDFEISNRLVTNREYLAFVEAGGYSDHNLWHSDGWDWKNQNKIFAPLYWQKKDNGWFFYNLNGREKLVLDLPVQNISYYEAYAFAEWKGMRLPTEAEWEVASNKFEWGQLWEWTESAYLPYPGFKKEEGALGEYNGKFMVNQKVLKGASNATPLRHSRKTYRNFFHPEMRWQFAGIRLVKK